MFWLFKNAWIFKNKILGPWIYWQNLKFLKTFYHIKYDLTSQTFDCWTPKPATRVVVLAGKNIKCSDFSKIHVFLKFKIWTHEFANLIVILTKFKIVGDNFKIFCHIKYERPFQKILIDGPQTWNSGGSAGGKKNSMFWLFKNA